MADYNESMNFVFANHSKENSVYPLMTKEIAESQSKDRQLEQFAIQEGYSTQLVENIKILCKDGKIVIPKNLQDWAMAWYHHYLQHPGSTCLEETLCSMMYWKGMQHTVQSHAKNCHNCKVNKRQKLKYGKLPTKLAITNPWEAVCVDLIGPYTLNGKDGTQIDFTYVTMINPATSWFELVELPVSQLPELDTPMNTKGLKGTNTCKQHKRPYFDKTSATVGILISKTWFSHYPCSQCIVYDKGSEFKLHFETLCDSYGSKHKPTIVKNLQSNAILHVHQTIMGMLCTAEIDMADTVREIDIADFLTNAAWAICSTYHTVLKASLGAAIFGWGMLSDVPFIANWKKIGEHRQCQMDCNTAHENKTHVDWDYTVGDKVLLRKDGILHKTESKYESDPWNITLVHTNGTFRVQRRPKSE